MFPFYSISISFWHLTFTVLESSLRPIETVPVASSDPYYTHKQPITILFLPFYIYRLLVFFFFLQGDNRNTADPYHEQNYIHALPGIRTRALSEEAAFATDHSSGSPWLQYFPYIFRKSIKCLGMHSSLCFYESVN